MAPDTVTSSERGGRMPAVAPIRAWHSIGFKIMFANAIALLMLGLGVVMFSEYKRSVVFTELSLLEDEARLWALLIDQSGNAVPAQLNELIGVSPRRAFVFDPDGKLIGHVERAAAAYETRVLNHGDSFSLIRPLAKFLLAVFPVKYDLPIYPEASGDRVYDFPGTRLSANGVPSMNAWVRKNGQLMFTAAVPLRVGDPSSGTLLLVKDVTQTEEAFQMARLDVVRILLAALAITLTLALYIAFMVARPLNRLARAAEQMRTPGARAQKIPDLSERGDEIGALSVVLRQATEALWHRLDAIEGFAADVSHELKNPLTSLRSALETFPKLKDPEKQARLLAIMTEDTQRLDRLITDIAKASRLDAELSREALSAVSLRRALDDVVRRHVPTDLVLGDGLPSEVQSRVRGVIIEAHVSDDLPMVRGNDIRLQQVFDNLLGNALSFSPDHGRVVISAQRAGDLVQVRVDDQGPGIPEAKLATIFTRFYSERPGTESFGAHSGLGLSIAKQIVDAAGGNIHAENRVDDQGRVRGARFTVLLPVMVIEEVGHG